MKDPATVKRFIELRAEGWSLSHISREAESVDYEQAVAEKQRRTEDDRMKTEELAQYYQLRPEDCRDLDKPGAAASGLHFPESSVSTTTSQSTENKK